MIRFPGSTRRLWWIAPLVAILTLTRFLPLAEWALTFADGLRHAGWRGVGIFVVVYVVAEVCLVPGSMLTMAAGFAYGPVVGLMVASPASLLAACASFLLARTALRGRLRTWLRGAPHVDAVNASVRDNSVLLVLLLRLSPLIPFNVLNYALGLTDVSLGRYFLASLVGMLPGTWLYVHLGSLAPDVLALGGAGGLSTTSAGTAVTALAVVSTVGVVYLVSRMARRVLAQRVPALVQRGAPSQGPPG